MTFRSERINSDILADMKLLDAALLAGLSQSGESREQALHILASLKNYHQTRNFSYQERFGVDDPTSVEMLRHLDELMERSK